MNCIGNERAASSCLAIRESWEGFYARAYWPRPCGNAAAITRQWRIPKVRPGFASGSRVESILQPQRPRSYFWPLGLERHLLARVKGAERKAELKQLIDAGGLDDIPDFLAHSALSQADRQGLGRIHPAFMGGEYLPDLSQNEVMIASITIASTTQDVTSVYARRGKKRIYYRVVDEYGGETLSGRNTRTSAEPLTLGQLEKFFNGAWSILHVLAMNFDDYDLARMLGFVVRIESSFYPEIETLYGLRIKAWATARRAELGLDKIDEKDHESATTVGSGPHRE